MPASIIASASSAKYAGPEPETAVTASMCRSGRRTTAPRWVRHSSASARCSSPACAPAQMPAMPSWTVAGVFGIARTTGTPSASCASIAAVEMAAATESTVCFGVSDEPISRQQRLEVLRLDGDDDEAGAGDCLGVCERRRDAVSLVQLVGPLLRGAR